MKQYTEEQINRGTKEEMEHAKTFTLLRNNPGMSNEEAARAIAIEHLELNPDIYKERSLEHGGGVPAAEVANDETEYVKNYFIQNKLQRKTLYKNHPKFAQQCAGLQRGIDEGYFIVKENPINDEVYISATNKLTDLYKLEKGGNMKTNTQKFEPTPYSYEPSPYGGIQKTVWLEEGNHNGPFKKTRIVEIKGIAKAHRVFQTKDGLTGGGEKEYPTVDAAIEAEDKWLNEEQMACGGSVGGFEYKTVNTRSEAGLKEAEKLKEQGWKIISSGTETIQFERPKKMVDGGALKKSDFTLGEAKYFIQVAENGDIETALKELGSYHQIFIDAKKEGDKQKFGKPIDFYINEYANAIKYVQQNVGKIPNNYAGKTPAQVWDMWSTKQRAHFLHDHDADLMNNSRIDEFTGEDIYTSDYIIPLAYENLPPYVKATIKEHITDGQYADGGPIKKFDINSLIGKYLFSRTSFTKIVAVDKITEDNIKVKSEYSSGTLTKEESFTTKELFDLSKGKIVDGKELITPKQEQLASGGAIGGRGFFGLTKGEKITDASQIKKSDIILGYSKQFNANNTYKIVDVRKYGTTIQNDCIYWNPKTNTRIGNEDMSISDLDVNGTSVEYYFPKDKKADGGDFDNEMADGGNIKSHIHYDNWRNKKILGHYEVVGKDFHTVIEIVGFENNGDYQYLYQPSDKRNTEIGSLKVRNDKMGQLEKGAFMNVETSTGLKIKIKRIAGRYHYNDGTTLFSAEEHIKNFSAGGEANPTPSVRIRKDGGDINPNWVLLKSVNTYLDTTNGDTYALTKSGEFVDKDEPVNLQDIEISEWFNVLSSDEKKIVESTFQKTKPQPTPLEKLAQQLEPKVLNILKKEIGNSKDKFMSQLGVGGVTVTDKNVTVWLDNQYNYDITVTFKYNLSGKLIDSSIYHSIKEWEYELKDIDQVGGFENEKQTFIKIADEIGKAIAPTTKKEDAEPAKKGGAKIKDIVGYNKRKHGLRFNKLCPVGTKIQHLQFPKGAGKKDAFTEAEAKEWTIKHKFKWLQKFVEVKQNTIHARQQPKTRFKPDSFKTIELSDGVQAIVGCLKK